MNATQQKRRYLAAHGVSVHFGGTAYHLGGSDCPWVATKLERKRKRRRKAERASRRANRT